MMYCFQYKSVLMYAHKLGGNMPTVQQQFGSLVRALRKEQFEFEQGSINTWSRAKLAKKSNLRNCLKSLDCQPNHGKSFRLCRPKNFTRQI